MTKIMIDENLTD